MLYIHSHSWGTTEEISLFCEFSFLWVWFSEIHKLYVDEVSMCNEKAHWSIIRICEPESNQSEKLALKFYLSWRFWPVCESWWPASLTVFYWLVWSFFPMQLHTQMWRLFLLALANEFSDQIRVCPPADCSLSNCSTLGFAPGKKRKGREEKREAVWLF